MATQTWTPPTTETTTETETTTDTHFVELAVPVLVSRTLSAEEKMKEAEKEHGHGEAHKLGEITLNGTVFTGSLAGHLKVGEEVEIILSTKGALPKTSVRGWIGIESGTGSTQGKVHDEDGGLCIHAEVPNPLLADADAKVWVEIDGEGGQAKAALGLQK